MTSEKMYWSLLILLLLDMGREFTCSTQTTQTEIILTTTEEIQTTVDQVEETFEYEKQETVTPNDNLSTDSQQSMSSGAQKPVHVLSWDRNSSNLDDSRNPDSYEIPLHRNESNIPKPIGNATEKDDDSQYKLANVTYTIHPDHTLDKVTQSTTNNDTMYLQVPFCCFDNRHEGYCTNRYPQSIPVAIGHCKPPDLQDVWPIPLRNMSCPASYPMKVPLSEEIRIISTGRGLAFSFDNLLISEFCVEEDSETNNTWWGVLCSPDSSQPDGNNCQEGKCFRKCCPGGYILQNLSCICYEGPSLYSDVTFSMLTNSASSQSTYGVKHLTVGIPECQHFIISNASFDSLKSIGALGTYSVSSAFECVDHVLDDSDNNIMTYPVQMSCRAPEEEVWKIIRRVLIPAGLVVSCVFLTGTLLCHLSVAPLRDLHGLCLAAYIGTLLVADMALFVIKVYSYDLADSTCLALGMIVRVSFLSAFMWLNVTCFDIWIYVGQTVQAVPLYRTPSDFRWFFFYGVYAWGFPISNGVVIGVLQNLPANHSMAVRSDFADNYCWFNEGTDYISMLFCGASVLLLLMNIILIVHTGLRLYFLHHSCCFRCSNKSSTDSEEHQPLHRPHLNEFWERFVLFAILACCWATEPISCLFGNGESAIWGLTDTINAFQGVFIFLVVLKNTKKRRLMSRSLKQWLKTLRQGGSSCWSKVSPPSSTSTGQFISHLKGTVNASPPKNLLNNVFFRERLSRMSSSESIIDDDATNDDDFKHSTNPQKLSSVWTIPQWKSLTSKSYFPNTTSAYYETDNSGQNNQSFFETFSDLQSEYSPYDLEYNTEFQPGSESNLERNAFVNWNLLRTRSGSVTLREEENRRDAECDVICQALKRRDLK